MKYNDWKLINDYEAARNYFCEPWKKVAGKEVNEFVLNSFGIKLEDLFLPIRSSNYILQDILIAQHTGEVKNLVSHFSCSLCNGLLKNTIMVKWCLHRYCDHCINRWLRLGNKSCPKCGVKIQHRRQLRKERIISGLMQIIYGKFYADPKENKVPNSLDENIINDNESDRNVDSKMMEFLNISDVEYELDYDKPKQQKTRMRQKKTPYNSSIGSLLVGNNEDKLKDGYYEAFLVCINQNLSPAVCSMARELSKRPLKLSLNMTSYEAGIVLAKKLIRDVLGTGNIQFIIQNLSFVRDGEFYPALSTTPLTEVSRNVTEGKGPNVIRYLLSNTLFSMCERAEGGYSM